MVQQTVLELTGSIAERLVLIAVIRQTVQFLGRHVFLLSPACHNWNTLKVSVQIISCIFAWTFSPKNPSTFIKYAQSRCHPITSSASPCLQSCHNWFFIAIYTLRVVHRLEMKPSIWYATIVSSWSEHTFRDLSNILGFGVNPLVKTADWGHYF